MNVLVFEGGHAVAVQLPNGEETITKTSIKEDALKHQIQIETREGTYFISRFDPRIEFRDGCVWSSATWRKDPLWYKSPIVVWE